MVVVFIYDCDEWQEIISLDSEEARKQRNLYAPSQQVCVPKLETIHIENCNKLKIVFSATVVTSLPKLHNLQVRDCNECEKIINLGSREVEKHKKFFASSQNKYFPKLESIWVERCNKLKTIFFAEIVSRLPNLHTLFVGDCNNLEAKISPYLMEAKRLRNLSDPSHQVRFP